MFFDLPRETSVLIISFLGRRKTLIKGSTIPRIYPIQNNTGNAPPSKYPLISSKENKNESVNKMVDMRVAAVLMV